MVDSQEILKCPACGKEMQKIYISSKGLNIDICTLGCGGIFFDNREYKKFDEKNENIDEIIKAIENKTFSSVVNDALRICPACGAKMVKNYASIKQEVQVDDCYTCGGKFLDHGELTKIRNQYETEAERAQDAVSFLYKEIGAEMQKLDAQISMTQKSALKTLFDKLIMGR